MKQISSKCYLYTVAALVALAGALTYYYLFSGFSAKTEEQVLYIDADDTADSVYVKLQATASTHSITGFKVLARHWSYADHVHPGRYAISPSISTFRLFRAINAGRQTPLHLTIPEARTLDRLAALLAPRLMADSAALAKTLADSALLAARGATRETVAALIVPNTYDVYWTITPEELLDRLIKEHDTFWAGHRTEKAKLIGLSPLEVATLASIVDEETASNAEKPMIAGMYINRLHQNMPLQADPTVKFALGDFSIRRIYQHMLGVNSPYNTYKNTGLPPGPIKIASVAGIDAVLNRVEHDYIYMCAKEDFSGTHNFAKTYKEHLANAARYSKALNDRGIGL